VGSAPRHRLRGASRDPPQGPRTSLTSLRRRYKILGPRRHTVPATRGPGCRLQWRATPQRNVRSRGQAREGLRASRHRPLLRQQVLHHGRCQSPLWREPTISNSLSSSSRTRIVPSRSLAPALTPSWTGTTMRTTPKTPCSVPPRHESKRDSGSELTWRVRTSQDSSRRGQASSCRPISGATTYSAPRACSDRSASRSILPRPPHPHSVRLPGGAKELGRGHPAC
jgi:hypothetical protein